MGTLETTTTASAAVNPAYAIASFQAMADALGYLPVQDEQRAEGYAYLPAPVLRKSTNQAIQLAAHLKAKGAIFYGAYWCPHCRNQREMFGAEALALIPMIECDARGYGFDGIRCEAT